MLRIYLDWNCITHLKEPNNKQLFDDVLSNKDLFIFPFSPAHFEDLQRSRPTEDKQNESYYKDLDLLQSICENHLIMFDNDKKRVLPFAATPYEYIEKAKDTDTLDDIFKYNSFSEYIKEEIGEPYNSIINDQIKKVPIEANIPIFSKEKITNGIDLLDYGFQYMKKLQTQDDYNKELSAGIRAFDQASFKRIAGASSNNIHNEIDKMISKTCPQFNLDKLINLSLQQYDQKSDMTEFISYYLSYDFIGFKQDRGHDLRNITTDAKHAYYGSYCDILVTNDKRMAEKAKAVYKDKKIRTKVITSNELLYFMHQEIYHQFSIKPFIMDLGCNIHFKSTYQSGDIHCRFSYFSSPFLGFFNYGMVVYDIDKQLPYFIFQRKIIENDMVFFTEIDKLKLSIAKLIGFETKNYDAICDLLDTIKQKKDSSYCVQIKKWLFSLHQDSEFPGVPLLAISKSAPHSPRSRINGKK